MSFVPIGEAIVALDEDIRQFLESVASVPRPSELTVPVAEMRRATDAASMSRPRPVVDADNETFSIPGRDGPIRARRYVPDSDGPHALILYLHGGGFVFGNIDTHHDVNNRLCLDTGAQVIAVDYRLAPENPFPAGVNDVVDSLHWVARNYGSFGVDPQKIFVLGDSAGGNFAAVAAQVARDEGMNLAGQVLIYPVVDFRDIEYESRLTRAAGYGLTQADMWWYRTQYLGDEGDGSDLRASPLANETLSGLAPAFVMTAGYDPLHSEGEEYAHRLKSAGVEVEYLHLPGANHGVFSNFSAFKAGETTWQAVLDWLETRT